MDVRQRRLISDHQALLDLANGNPFIEVQTTCASHDRYTIVYHCKGLLWLPGRPRPAVTTEHRVDVYLHADYPRLPPRLQWLTDIFHPNILPPKLNGGVCIGKWTPAETLDRLIIRIGEMVQYKNFSTEDALNPEAAAWADQNRRALPVDNTPLTRELDPALGIILGVK